jgi:phytoene desaturase
MEDGEKEASITIKESKKVVIIGAGFAGLSAACCLAHDGFEVIVLDRCDEVGGRCNSWGKDGFTFDMGPSWYWMPDVFDDFFARFGRKTEDFYKLKRLDPAYRIFFEKGRPVDIPDSAKELEELFEKIHPGSGMNFRRFMEQAEYDRCFHFCWFVAVEEICGVCRYKYKVAMSDYVKRPSLNLTEFIDLKMLRESLRLQMFSSQSSHVRSFFSHPDLIKIMEWPVLFLGGAPDSVPAMYSLLNYAAIGLGTWYPKVCHTLRPK